MRLPLAFRHAFPHHQAAHHAHAQPGAAAAAAAALAQGGPAIPQAAAALHGPHLQIAPLPQQAAAQLSQLHAQHHANQSSSTLHASQAASAAPQRSQANHNSPQNSANISPTQSPSHSPSHSPASLHSSQAADTQALPFADEEGQEEEQLSAVSSKCQSNSPSPGPHAPESSIALQEDAYDTLMVDDNTSCREYSVTCDEALPCSKSSPCVDASDNQCRNPSSSGNPVLACNTQDDFSPPALAEPTCQPANSSEISSDSVVTCALQQEPCISSLPTSSPSSPSACHQTGAIEHMLIEGPQTHPTKQSAECGNDDLSRDSCIDLSTTDNIAPCEPQQTDSEADVVPNVQSQGSRKNGAMSDSPTMTDDKRDKMDAEASLISDVAMNTCGADTNTDVSADGSTEDMDESQNDKQATPMMEGDAAETHTDYSINDNQLGRPESMEREITCSSPILHKVQTHSTDEDSN